VIVGDVQETDTGGVDWRGVPYKTTFENSEDEAHFVAGRRLVQATRESLYAAIETCRPGGCLSDVGAAVHDVADAYGYNTVEKYRGHGISTDFHCAPFVKHFRNTERVMLKPGMIFTIEPMLTQGSAECFEWEDDWTVATSDGGLAAQFEHTIFITENGDAEILTLPDE
jgi:methionyl aminopeptidase